MINEKIKQAIQETLPLSFGKIGSIEAAHISRYLIWKNSVNYNPSLFINAGVYVKDEDDFIEWFNDYIESVKDIEPYTHKEDGWHYSLSDKKVLFVSPFSDTVKEQAKKYNKIWNGASIGEVLTVRSPYSEALTGEPPTRWASKLNKMIDEIRELDFDFATVGCGGLSLSVCRFIKSMGKPCVHLGGGNQLLFGIKGKRWDDHELLSKFYNEHWIRPLAHEVPKNNTLVEGGCYW